MRGISVQEVDDLLMVHRQVENAWRAARSSGRLFIVLVSMTLALLASASTLSVTPASASPDSAGKVVATGDGCTDSPDGNGLADFDAACAAHDACYSTGSTESRLRCDDQFKDDLHAACGAAYPLDIEEPNFRRLAAACHQTAGIYYGAVRSRGRSHYEGSGDPA
jgi:hypothetical protein